MCAMYAKNEPDNPRRQLRQPLMLERDAVIDESTARLAWLFSDATWKFFVRREEKDAQVALRWWWRVSAPNGMTCDGEATFDTRPLCQADAARHGFLPRSVAAG